MAVCIVVWIVEAVLNLVWQGGLNAMLNAGMLMPATAVHKPWTFITSMFLHQPNSLWHILFNMLTLWCVGPVLERMMGHWSFLALYAVSGLAGRYRHDALGRAVRRFRLDYARIWRFRGIVRPLRRHFGGLPSDWS